MGDIMACVICPTAQAMLTLAGSLDEQPVQAYLCTWTAFESITRLMARQSGVKPQFSLRKNGTLRLMEMGDIKMPKVTAPNRELILTAALEQLDVAVQHALIAHKSVEYFANRTPTFDDRVLKSDSRGQQLNGVIDISRTLDARYPIWNPISIAWYKAFIRREADDALYLDLVTQIVSLLDTLRDNILYADGTNDQECGLNLVNCAQPLLNILINGLTSGV